MEQRLLIKWLLCFCVCCFITTLNCWIECHWIKLLELAKTTGKHTESCIHNYYTTLHPFNGPFSGTTQVSQYQKVKPIWILLKQETVSGSGISWAICKSAPRSRQITTPALHHSVFYRPDALPAAQPTASKHWRISMKMCKGILAIVVHLQLQYCLVSCLLLTVMSM